MPATQATLVKRLTKGSPLSALQMDNNLTNLNQYTLDAETQLADGTTTFSQVTCSTQIVLGAASDDSNKGSLLIANQYDHGSEAEGYTSIYNYSDVDENVVNLGGGHTGHNAATEVAIWAISGVGDKRTGTKQVSVSNAAATFTGNIVMSTADATVDGRDLTADGTILDAATNANTASAIVKRDGSGDFAAGKVTSNLVGDVYASNGTSSILDSGTDGTDATFTGALTGNCSGSAATVTGGTQASITAAANLTTVGTVAAGTWGTGAVIGTPTMTLGSDVDGDIYYRSSDILTRLAKGTAGQILGMNAGATAPEWKDDPPRGKVLQVVVAASSTSATTTAAIPSDDTIPQSSEGTAYDSLDCAITPTASDSKLLIQVVMPNATNDSSGGYGIVVALFRDSATGALAVSGANTHDNNAPHPIVMTYYDNAVSTSATTYKIRFAVTNGGTARLNQRYGTAAVSTIVVTEIAG